MTGRVWWAVFGVVLIGLAIGVWLSLRPRAPAPRAAATVSTAPVTLLGVTMDKPLTLPECKRGDFSDGDTWRASYYGKITCALAEEETDAERGADPAFRDRKQFRIAIPSASMPSYITQIAVSTLRGKVADITVFTNGQAGQNKAFQDLKDKFGKPTASMNRMMQNGFGMQFESPFAHWVLMPQNVLVQYEGMGRSREEGHITVWSKAMQDAERDFESRHPSPRL